MSIPAPLLAALAQLGLQGIAELGPPLVKLLRSWIVALTSDPTRTQAIEGEPSLADQMVATCRRVVKRYEEAHPDWKGSKKEQAVRMSMEKWNEGHGNKFRTREIHATISLAVLALDLSNEWDEAAWNDPNLVDRNALLKQAEEHDAKAKDLRQQAANIHQAELAAMPLFERLVFAATSRCPCGAGLAYDPAGESGKPIHGYWDCSAILLGIAVAKEQPGSIQHTAQLPFVFYEIKSEGQPSAQGATTRPGVT